MGYWNAGSDGSSLHADKTGLVWGDSPADIFDDALDKIWSRFVEDVGRPPSEEEIRSGLEFSLRGLIRRKEDEGGR